MIHIRHLSFLLAILVVVGCQDGRFSVAPQWSCIRAEAKIDLSEKLDLSVDPPQLVNVIGMIEVDESVKILDRHKDPSDSTTHFRIRAQNGVKGWFAWEGNEFVGWTGRSCW